MSKNMKKKIRGLVFLLLLAMIPTFLTYYNSQESVKMYDEYRNALMDEYEDNGIISNVDGKNVVKDLEGIISIPKIKEELPIFYGTDNAVLDKGVGIVEGSQGDLKGGKGTNVALSAHRGMVTKDLFKHLDKLEVGDVYYIQERSDFSLMKAYVVEDTYVVNPDDSNQYKTVDDKEISTLITCTPYMLNYDRLIVKAERAPEKDVPIEEYKTVMVDKTFLDSVQWEYIIAALLAFLLVILSDIRKAKKKEKKLKEKELIGNSDNNIDKTKDTKNDNSQVKDEDI